VYQEGVRENTIMNRIIPAGTGFAKYRNYNMNILDKTDEVQESLEATVS